jgi:hypothetical protein
MAYPQVQFDNQPQQVGPLAQILRAAGAIMGKNKLERDTTVPGDTNPEQAPRYKTGFWDTLYGGQGQRANLAADIDEYNRQAGVSDYAKAVDQQIRAETSKQQERAKANIYEKKEGIPLEAKMLTDRLNLYELPRMSTAFTYDQNLQNARLANEAARQAAQIASTEGLHARDITSREGMHGADLASRESQFGRNLAATQAMHSADLNNRLAAIGLTHEQARATHAANATVDTIEAAKRGDADAARHLAVMEASIPIQSRAVFAQAVARGDADSVNLINGLYTQSKAEDITSSGQAGPTAQAMQAANLNAARAKRAQAQSTADIYQSPEGQELLQEGVRSELYKNSRNFTPLQLGAQYYDPRTGEQMSSTGTGVMSRLLPNYNTRKAAAEATEQRMRSARETGKQGDVGTAYTPPVSTAVTPAPPYQQPAQPGQPLPGIGAQLMRNYGHDISNFLGGFNRMVNPSTAEIEAAAQQTQAARKRYLE